MAEENRISTRYNEIARIISPELCVLPGILDNISLSGCKVHFPLLLNIDTENEYELKIIPSRINFDTPMKLICVPQWVKTNEEEGSTELGFKILYSPDANRLQVFIDYLEKLSQDELPDID